MNASHRFIGLALLMGLLSTPFVYGQDNIILKNGSEIQAKVLEVSPGQIKYRRQDNPDGPIYTTGTTDVLLIKYANGTKDVLGQSTSRSSRMAPAPMNPVLSAPAPSTGATTPGRLGYHTGLFSRYFTNSVGERIDNSVARSLLVEHPDAMRIYRRGQSLRKWTYATAGTGLALIGAGAIVAAVGDGGFGRNEGNRRDGTTTNSTINNDERNRGDHGSAEVGIALAGGGVLLGVAAIILDHRATVQFRRAADRYNQQQPATSLRFGPSSRGLGIGMTYTF
ncbi:hypothetical protein GO755_12885 [Spirosoma sp. HMF4905]|uniref:Uncharacterized protein n=1 Tax=Spirosoma arboris TaxID=2682092 RepID=A0A7K1SAX6_9BACT|nr:hypothetical protein [Spirosoma arboris]MVM30930.1 hypothetical protein [Spirosoma arboris]